MTSSSQSTLRSIATPAERQPQEIRDIRGGQYHEYRYVLSAAHHQAAQQLLRSMRGLPAQRLQPRDVTAAREAMGITWQAMADEAGVCVNCVFRWRNKGADATAAKRIMQQLVSRGIHLPAFAVAPVATILPDAPGTPRKARFYRISDAEAGVLENMIASWNQEPAPPTRQRIRNASPWHAATLLAWRKRRGFSQFAVSLLLGIGASQVCRWEKGTVRPSLRYRYLLDELADRFGK